MNILRPTKTLSRLVWSDRGLFVSFNLLSCRQTIQSVPILFTCESLRILDMCRTTSAECIMLGEVYSRAGLAAAAWMYLKLVLLLLLHCTNCYVYTIDSLYMPSKPRTSSHQCIISFCPILPLWGTFWTWIYSARWAADSPITSREYSDVISTRPAAMHLILLLISCCRLTRWPHPNHFMSR